MWKSWAGKGVKRELVQPGTGTDQLPATKRAKAVGGAVIDRSATSGTGEVRFEHALAARQALSMDGTMLNGSKIGLSLDPTSKDSTKLIVTGLPAGIEWQELKDHFAQIGDLAFVNIIGSQKHGRTMKIGEVRYESAYLAQQALEALQGCEMEEGRELSLTIDPHSKDGSKLIVSGVPAGIGWQELKDFLQQAGPPVTYCGLASADPRQYVGEVRYESAEHAQAAMQALNGSMLLGSQIFIMSAPDSQDGTKLMVKGFAPGTQWQELKDHFGQIGPVAFAAVHQKHSQDFWQNPMLGVTAAMGSGGGKKGGKKGGFGMDPMQMMSMMTMMCGYGGYDDSACWDMQKKGFCPRGGSCKWCAGTGNALGGKAFGGKSK